MWRKLMIEPFRGVALVLLWLPIKFARLFTALIIVGFALELFQDREPVTATLSAVASLLGFGTLHIVLPRFHYWLRTAGR